MEDDVLRRKEVVSVTFDTTSFVSKSCMIGGFIPGSQPGQLTKNKLE